MTSVRRHKHASKTAARYAMRVGVPRTFFLRLGLVLLSITVSGCEGMNSRLLNTHFGNNGKNEAKERWDTVRGGVKIQLARQHLKSGRLEEAQRALDEALTISPNDPQAYVLATQLKLEQGQLGEARQAITLATLLKSDDHEIQFLAGLVAQRYGDLAGAYENYAQAAFLAPQSSDYLIAQVEVLVSLDRPIDALELIEPRLRDFDRNIALRQLTARITRILGLRGPTIEYCREAFRLGGEDPDLAIELGQTLVWAERYREAIVVLAPVVDGANGLACNKEGPSAYVPGKVLPSAYCALAQAYLHLGQVDPAMQLLRRVMHDCPEDVISWRLYARAGARIGNLETASEALQVLKDRGAMTAETWMLAGYVALRRGDLFNALDASRRAVMADASLAAAHYLLGETAEALGDLAEARSAYSEAIRRDPKLYVAQHRLNVLNMQTDAASTIRDDGCVEEWNEFAP